MSAASAPAPRVLYISSGGIEEPLIVSQVLRYLERLSDVYQQCHLITFERNSLDSKSEKAHRIRLKESNIHWHPITAHSGFRLINLWRDIHAGYRQAVALVAAHDLNLVHCRSFVPGNIGLRVASKTGVKFLYDMRGFWAEEKWAKGTIRHPWIRRFAQRLENQLFHKADALVSLTQSGKAFLQQAGIQTPIEVIPCCVDSNLFHPKPSLTEGDPTLISVGSLGPGYLPEAVFGVYAAAQEIWPHCKLILLTRTSDEIISSAAKTAGVSLDDVLITSASPGEVPGMLQQADIGLCLIQPSMAKLASSPTKLAEYLACGLPMIANGEGIGDVGDMLHHHRVGINLTSLDRVGYQQSVRAIDELRNDPELTKRCQSLVESEFSVEVGVRRYAAMYRQLCESRN